MIGSAQTRGVHAMIRCDCWGCGFRWQGIGRTSPSIRLTSRCGNNLTECKIDRQIFRGFSLSQCSTGIGFVQHAVRPVRSDLVECASIFGAV